MRVTECKRAPCPRFLSSMRLTLYSQFPFPFFTAIYYSSTSFHARSVPSLSFLLSTSFLFLHSTLLFPTRSPRSSVQSPFLDISLVPRHNFPYSGRFFVLSAAIICTLPLFSLPVHSLQFSGMITLVHRLVTRWRGCLFICWFFC